MKKSLVILDIDETLWHADLHPHKGADVILGDYGVILRPYLKELLEYTFRDWAVALWTHGTRPYADKAASQLLSMSPQGSSFAFVYARENCTPRRVMGLHSPLDFHIKNLTKLKRKGYDLNQVVIVDNTPSTANNNYGNLIHIPSFWGDKSDTKLLDLIHLLKEIKDEPNYRKVAKFLP